MRVPEKLSTAFDRGHGSQFEAVLDEFLVDNKLTPEVDAIHSDRYLSRSVLPHVLRLSELFNRLEDPTISSYWGKGSNPAHLRLAYFLYFMPSNLYRVAAIWAELGRLGYRWPFSGPLQAIDFGSGPATATCGIAAGESYLEEPSGIPIDGNWALVEQDSEILKLGAKWSSEYFSKALPPNPSSGEHIRWDIRPFARKIVFDQETLLPPKSPKFQLFLMSYFLNEISTSPKVIADKLLKTLHKHLEEEGLVILVEPALKTESRKILEVRKHLIESQKGDPWLQVLLPCLGHQACGALSNPEDWCHEEVGWWRPSYFRIIDQMAKLDRKTLPFSYLVLMRTKKKREDILPELKDIRGTMLPQRLVSPARFEKPFVKFYLCGQNGKLPAMTRAGSLKERPDLERGDILVNAQIENRENSLFVKFAETADETPEPSE